MIIRGLEAGQIVQALQRNLSGANAPARCISDHRRLQAGDVWFAVPGQRFDPRGVMAAVADLSLAAVVAEADGFPDEALSVADSMACPVYLLSGLAEQAGAIAADLLFAQTPAPRLFAVTGTNGKTSVTRWIAQALSHLNERCATVGTLGAGFVDEVTEYTGMTTPDAVSLQNAIAALGRAGARSVALEASSIGLHQGRLSGCRFSVAAFTNLSRDHLDYHGTMQAYEQAKQALFSWPSLHSAVINLDDPAAPRFAAVAEQAGVPVIGVTAAGSSLARLTPVLALQGQHSEGGLAISLQWKGETAQAQVGVVGQFNLENIAVVSGVLLASGYPLLAVADALSVLTPPPGRMQMIKRPAAPLLVVDYAHTPDALEKALSALRPVVNARDGKLVCVFGCGGDRDPGKRPLMGTIAQRLSDRVYITSDNPRSESPQSIIDAILQGVQDLPAVQVISDRAEAISHAVAHANARDVVLLAGKGHEDGQIVGDVVLPFSDLAEAEKALDAYAIAGGAA